MDNILYNIPDKIVADDITNFLSDYKYKHLFSDIFEGRTALCPHNFIVEKSNVEEIYLYEGGWGFGNYMRIVYSIKEKMYIFYTFSTEDKENPPVEFKSDDWDKFHKYVRQYMLDTFMWFNKGK